LRFVDPHLTTTPALNLNDSASLLAHHKTSHL
jgi:hypothetical protein